MAVGPSKSHALSGPQEGAGGVRWGLGASASLLGLAKLPSFPGGQTEAQGRRGNENKHT